MTLVRLFVLFGGLIVLSLFGLLIGPYFIDWSAYKADFERQASLVIGQKVVVKGETELSLLPFPSITFTDLEIGESQNGQPMMVAEKFEMDLEISPLLSGEILIFDMRIDRPLMSVTLFEDGTLDWAMGERSDLGGNHLVLENVTVTNGEIILLDQQNQRTERIENIQAALSASEITGPWLMNGSARVHGMPFEYKLATGAMRADGKVRLRGRITSALYPMALELEGDTEINENRPRYTGNFSIQKLSDKNVLNTPAQLRPLLNMRIKGAFELSNENLELSQYRFLSGSENDPYVVEGNARLDFGQVPEFDVFARGQQIDVERLSDVKDQSPSVERTTSEIGFARLLALVNQIPIPDIPGKIDLTLPAVVAGDTTIRQLELKASPIQTGWRLINVSAQLPGRTNIEASGDLQLSGEMGFTGRLLIASQQPSGFSSWLIGRVDPEIRQMGAAGLSADVILNDDRQSFENLQLILGSTSIKGMAERRRDKGDIVQTSLNLEGNELDIDRVIALLNLINSGKDIADGGQIFEQNIIATIKTDLIKYQGYSAKGIDAMLEWNAGNLNLSNLTVADFVGVSGQISGEVKDFGQTPIGAFDFSAKGQSTEELATLILDLDDKNPIIKRLTSNIGAFSNFDITGRLDIDQKQLPLLTLKGAINGSDVSFEGNGQALVPFAFEAISQPLDIKILAANSDGAILLSQMGFDTLPLGFETSGNMALNFSRGFDSNINISSYLAIGDTEIDLIGYVAPKSNEHLENAKGEFDIAIKSDDIEPLVYILGQSLPGAGAGLPIELIAQVTVDKDIVQISEISGTSIENAFSGQLQLDRSKNHLNFTGNLNLSELDFDWLYELTLGTPIIDFPELNATNLPESSWSTSSFLPPLNSVPHTSIKLNADRTYVADLAPIIDFSGILSTEPGEMNIQDITGRWYGGQVRADVLIANPDGSAFSRVAGSLKGGDIATITSSAIANPRFDGQIDIVANLEGAGNNLSQMIKSANGGGTYELNDVQIANFQPNILRQILSFVDNEQFQITEDNVTGLAEDLVSNGSFYLEQLEVPFAITGGVQRIANMDIKSSNPRLTGEARYDLAEQSMTANLDIVFDPGLEAQQGASAELSYMFSGPYNAPLGKIDSSAMSNFLSIRAYERERRRVELLQASILEKQRLRREIALVKDQQLRREEEARLKAEEEARQKAEEEARLQAELEAKLAAEAEAQRLAEEALQRTLEQRRTAEEEARRLADEAIERARLKALQNEADRIAHEKFQVEQQTITEAQTTIGDFSPAEEPVDQANELPNPAGLTQQIENFLDQTDNASTINDIEVIDLDAPPAE